jgi:hypothetical protein
MVVACICDCESFKNLLTTLNKSIFVIKIRFEFGQYMRRKGEVLFHSTSILNKFVFMYVYLFPCKIGTNVGIDILTSKKLSTITTLAIATLALGSQPKQGVGRLRAKRETRESLHMLPRVQKVWGNEPSHSQMNSHVGSWSPKRTPKFSERNCRDQNSLPWSVLYIIGNILKRRCLKWARIAHLDIWNTNYGQKKGRESNWQFDSWPLKVKNQPDFLACRWCATYR